MRSKNIAISGKVVSSKNLRPYVSIVNSAGNTNTKFRVPIHQKSSVCATWTTDNYEPNPSDAIKACVTLKPDSWKIVEL